MSDGNGHPYSWSAICNGYSPVEMAACGFPVIPQYLSKQTWPEARLPVVEVSHVWTQDPTISNKIARAALIPNIVYMPEEMIGKVDGLLLARDDAENHLKIVAPFLKAGIPVYIDKPIALNIDALDMIYALQQYEGQIFTCSALRFAEELQLTPELKNRIGKIRHIEAVAPKSWKKYAVHIIEPVLKMLKGSSILNSQFIDGFAHSGGSVFVQFEDGVSARFTALGSETMAPLSLRVFGDEGWVDLVFSDTFTAFKKSLSEFLDGIRTSCTKSPYDFNKEVVSIIERGII
jgi:hypothetical protein